MRTHIEAPLKLLALVHFVRGNWCSLSVGAGVVCPRRWCSLYQSLVHFVRALVHFVPHISKLLYLSLGYLSSEIKVLRSKQIDQRHAERAVCVQLLRRKAIQGGSSR
jgi:hypothetical protein